MKEPSSDKRGLFYIFSLDPDFAVLMFLQQEPDIDADHIVLTPDNIIRSSSTTVIFAMRELAIISEKIRW